MGRRFKTQRIKANKSYSVGVLAEAACVSVPTVRTWIKSELPCIDEHHPKLVFGFSGDHFPEDPTKKLKRPLAVGEFYCFRCKSRRSALGAIADYKSDGVNGGHLNALCGVCECACNRNINAEILPGIGKVLDVKFRDI